MRIALTVLLLAWPIAAAEEKISIRTSRQGDLREVAVDMLLPVPLQRAWEVMTDFDRMSEFLPNLEESRIVGRQGERLQVRQRGVARYGWLRFGYASVREVSLTPYTTIEIKGSDDHVRQFGSRAMLTEQDGRTKLSYQAYWEPNGWLAGLIGDAAVREQVSLQFSALEREMLRRESQATNKGEAR
ncbi:SRPBCC family protein [Chitinimonas lacunae]|uniref:SRPBCC family protein n=1 Tax=Chitinimonas lacunae TaxID=1963018 RepID=A0ABV8ML96_9NEIS